MELSKTKELTNFHYISLSDVGAVRTNNEDSSGYFDTPNGHVFVVCDGCGGLPFGEIASQSVVKSIKFFFSNFYYTDPYQAMRESVEYAHKMLIEEGKSSPEYAGMATTMVLVLVRYDKVYYAHVGDSRIYLFDGRKLKQLTKDDSYVQTLVDRGQISEQDAEKHPRKNELIQVMGMSHAPEPHVCRKPIEPHSGDIILLCTDGLYNMITTNDISATLSHRGYIEDKGQKLLKTAIANGGYDNITLQIVKFFDMAEQSDNIGSPVMTDSRDKDSPNANQHKTPLMIAITIIMLSILGIMAYLRQSKTNDTIVPTRNPDSTIVIKTRYYDNLGTLELMYKTPKEQIIKANHLGSEHIEPGQELIIPTDTQQ